MNPTPAQPEGRRPFWCRKGPARRTFRWCRRTGYVVGAVVLYGAVHLNQVGLPGFAKEALLAQLRERGLELEFSRLRIRLGRGIVAENVNLGRSGPGASDQVFLDQLQLKLDWARVLRLHPEIRAVTIRGGKVALPLTDTNGVAGRFEVEEIEGLLRFTGPEVWELDHLRGRVLGGSFSASGTITNAGELRRRKPPESRSDAPGPWRRILARTVLEAENTAFASPPELVLRFDADLADPLRSTAEARLKASGAVTGHGDFEEVSLFAHLNRVPVTDGLFQVALELDSARAAFGTNSVDSLKWKAFLAMPLQGRLGTQLDWDLAVKSVQWGSGSLQGFHAHGLSTSVRHESPLLPWVPEPGKAAASSDVFRTRLEATCQEARLGGTLVGGGLDLEAEAVHGRHGWAEAKVRFRSSGAETPWGRAGKLWLEGELKPASVRELGFPAGPGWRFLQSIQGGLTLDSGSFRHPDLSVDQARIRLGWTNGVLELPELDARLLGGRLEAKGALDAAGRTARLEYRSDADPLGVMPLLREKGRRWLSQFEWDPAAPPRLDGHLKASLPDWALRGEPLRQALQDGLVLDGRFAGGPFRFRGIGGDSAQGRFAYTNRVWKIRGLEARRPEGGVVMDYEGDERTHRYHFDLKSGIDPSILKPLLTNAVVDRVFGDLRFSSPPRIDAVVDGYWFQPERTGLLARIEVADLSYRGEHLDSAAGTIGYTNRFLSVSKAVLRDGSQSADVDGFAYDIGAGAISFTNAVSTFIPGRVTHAIGGKVEKVMEPYVVTSPATVVVDGVIGVRGNPEGNDIRFDVRRAPDFRWWKFQAKEVSGQVLSLGPLLVVTNLDGGFHGGRLRGNLEFDLQPGQPNTFRIGVQAENANLHTLVGDLSDPGKTNQLEGAVTVDLRITEGLVSDQTTWKGGGRARLRDGYLWDQPLFGTLSTVLSGVSPGLGKARFNEGAATFTLADGRVRTRDLQLRAPSMALGFVGSVGFQRDLDMVVQGSMFRSVPLLGTVAELALSPFEKLFEYKVTGTLERPKTEPAHIPSFLMIPLNPFGTLRDLLPDTKKAPVLPTAPGTNAPAVPPEPPKP